MRHALSLPLVGLLIGATLNLPATGMAQAPQSQLDSASAISFVGSEFNGSSRGSSSLTIDKPSGVVEGDVLVAMLGGDYGIPGTPSGWTKFAERDENRDLTGQGFFRVATGNEPSSYTWPVLGSSKRIASGTIVALRGADQVNPVFSFDINGETDHTEQYSDCPSADGIDGGALICAWIHDDPQRPEPPSGMVELSAFTIPGTNGNDDGHTTAYKLLTATEATGVQSAALDTSIGGGGNDMALAVVIAPSNNLLAESYIDFGSEWRYRDDGTDQGSGWRQPGFDDSAWSSGPAELGYGDGDEATVVESGPEGDRHITTYFRSSFVVPESTRVELVSGQLLRDDGAVVYVNGVEVFRTKLPSGLIEFDTQATSGVSGSAERTPIPFSVAPGVLVTGTNEIAVEIHQRSLNSSDISFDLQLTGLIDPDAGPPDEQPPTSPDPVALQPAITSVHVSWVEATDDSGSVSYDLLRDGELITNTANTEYTDVGLTPDTEYQYMVVARDPSANTTESAPMSTTTMPDTVPPTDPTALDAVALGATAVEVSWVASFDEAGPVTYTVLQNGDAVGTTADTTHIALELEAETSYDFSVQAADGAGNQSNAVGPVTVVTPVATVDPEMVAVGSVWRFLDDGSDQGSAWRALGFDDSSWSSGAAQLGYGDGDEATVVESGPAGDRHITTYFRRSFVVGDPGVFESLTLSLMRDDGAVVYINGVEVARSNMGGGAITYLSRASKGQSGSEEDEFHSFSVPASVLAVGSNVIAVEIHQRGASSSDISFDASLEGNFAGDLMVAVGSVWRFLDDGSDQGSAWRALGFDDSSWSSGAAQLGYGDGDEATVVESGPAGDRHITTYFRRSFVVGDPGVFESLTLSLMRDDGAVVYINGVEVARLNMGGGAITYLSRASKGQSGSEEDEFHSFSVPASVLAVGSNVIAVEIHQRGASSSDISFDASLEGIR